LRPRDQLTGDQQENFTRPRSSVLKTRDLTYMLTMKAT